MIKEIEIFNIRINCFNYPTIENSISLAINNNQQIVIGYVNFFSVNIIKKDSKFSSNISSMELVFPDGIGIWLGLKLTRKHITDKRFNLTDYGYKLLNFFSGNKLSVFMYGGEPEVLTTSMSKIQKQIPGIKIAGAIHGYSNKSDDEIVGIINKSNPDILLVGLGTPKQEEWIYNNRKRIKALIIISVGDLFGLYAETKKRGFKIVRVLGLEWFIRLITHPKKYYKRYLFGIPIYLMYLIEDYIRIKKEK